MTEIDTGIELVCADMEGTVFDKAVQPTVNNTAPSAWTAIAEHLGEDAHQEEEETKRKWERGEYDGYVEWMEDTIRIHKKYGLEEEFFSKVINSIEYNPGVKDTFEVLNTNEIVTALVTGGFKAQADKAQSELKIDHSFAACEYHWDNNGQIEHFNLLPCDFDGKIDFIGLILEEHGLDFSDFLFIGDGKNDAGLASAAEVGVAYTGHDHDAPEQLVEASDYVIEDFKELIHILEAN